MKLEPDDLFFAYHRGTGYVGFGKVIEPARMGRDIIIPEHGKRLFDLPVVRPNLKHDMDAPDLAECVVTVEWNKTYPVAQQAPSQVRLVGPEDVITRMIYTLANPVATKLVARAEQWPGVWG